VIAAESIFITVEPDECYDTLAVHWSATNAERTQTIAYRTEHTVSHRYRESHSHSSWSGTQDLTDLFDPTVLWMSVGWLHPRSLKKNVTPGWHATLYRDDDDEQGVKIPIEVLQ
jgi:hypothetical protein